MHALRILIAKNAHVTHELLPGSRLEILEGVGHFPHCERPEWFAPLIAEFIASTPSARSPRPNRDLRVLPGVCYP